MNAPSSNGTYRALRNSPRLCDDVGLFIDNIRGGLPEDQNPLLVNSMEGLLDEAIDTLIAGVLPRLSDTQVRQAATFVLDLVIRVDGERVMTARPSPATPATLLAGAAT